VFIVDAQNHVQRRNVAIGIQDADEVEIAGGLAAGDRVIASGQGNYQVGQTVRPKITVPLTSKDAGTQEGSN
jgi:hypothetical protein